MKLYQKDLKCKFEGLENITEAKHRSKEHAPRKRGDESDPNSGFQFIIRKWFLPLWLFLNEVFHLRQKLLLYS